MISLTALWLPILVSAVIVFFASFMMHMVLTHHSLLDSVIYGALTARIFGLLWPKSL